MNKNAFTGLYRFFFLLYVLPPCSSRSGETLLCSSITPQPSVALCSISAATITQTLNDNLLRWQHVPFYCTGAYLCVFTCSQSGRSPSLPHLLRS